jgi:hypothetical protein
MSRIVRWKLRALSISLKLSRLNASADWSSWK